MKSNVLIVDADIENSKQIKYSLQGQNVEAYYTHEISEALHLLRCKQYNLVILDVVLSQKADIGIMSKVRQLCKGSLFLLSEQASAAERVMAFQCGADDVLNKPYDLEECLARAYSLMRRDVAVNGIVVQSNDVVEYRDLLLDMARRRVSVSGTNISLTRKEYDILLYMITRKNHVMTFEQIYTAVWKDSFTGDNAILFYHIAQLRKKLGRNWIQNVYGVGYRLQDLDDK